MGHEKDKITHPFSAQYRECPSAITQAIHDSTEPVKVFHLLPTLSAIAMKIDAATMLIARDDARRLLQVLDTRLHMEEQVGWLSRREPDEPDGAGIGDDPIRLG